MSEIKPEHKCRNTFRWRAFESNPTMFSHIFSPPWMWMIRLASAWLPDHLGKAVSPIGPLNYSPSARKSHADKPCISWKITTTRNWTVRFMNKQNETTCTRLRTWCHSRWTFPIGDALDQTGSQDTRSRVCVGLLLSFTDAMKPIPFMEGRRCVKPSWGLVRTLFIWMCLYTCVQIWFHTSKLLFG